MKLIALTQGKVAIVNDHWFEYLNQFKWFAWHDPKNGHWYAVRNIHLPNGKKTLQQMHRVVMGEPEGLQIDHRDRSPEGGLNNREENLRIATRSQNRHNQGIPKHNTSGFKGVCRRGGKCYAQIKVNRKTIHLGMFGTAIEAAAFWNWAAKKLHGAFCYQNDLSQITDAALAQAA